jgi:hypothetical protein
MHRILIRPDIRLIQKPDIGYPDGYPVRPDTGYPLRQDTGYPVGFSAQKFKCLLKYEINRENDFTNVVFFIL